MYKAEFNKFLCGGGIGKRLSLVILERYNGKDIYSGTPLFM